MPQAATPQQLIWPHANNAGATPETPFNIVALPLARTLGDFVDQCLFAASFKNLFECAHLFLYWRQDRPYKKHVVSMIPNLNYSWSVGENYALPLDAFDNAAGAKVFVPNRLWYEMGCAHADIVLTPQMMDRTMLPSFPSLTYLRLPTEATIKTEQDLMARGVDPDNWFCVLHYREPNYRYRDSEPDRDLDPAAAVETVKFVISDLGGQVVRVGHPEMAPFPDIPGFVDLSREQDPFLLHAYAISRSRFFLELSTSGAVSLAWSMGVPVARCNCVSLYGPLDENSIVLPKRISRPNGAFMTVDEAIEERAIYYRTMKELLEPEGYSFHPNTLLEIKDASRRIFEHGRLPRLA